MKFNPSAFRNLLGINERNIRWIFPHNAREHFPQVDDKITTKGILAANDIPVPSTLAIIDSYLNMETEFQKLSVQKSLVLKPSRGKAGGGILILGRNEENKWSSPSGTVYETEDIYSRIGEILFGVYSFGGNDDRVLIEERINAHSFFLDIYPSGIADIRIILFRGNPVMAMARIPTEASDGKANLHQGAIGIGIDPESGFLKEGTHRNRRITYHPDTGKQFSGMKIPYWPDIMEIARKSASVVDLGYIGVDIVLSMDKGPLILELNARPGLAIQLANGMCLNPVLEKIG